MYVRGCVDRELDDILRPILSKKYADEEYHVRSALDTVASDLHGLAEIAHHASKQIYQAQELVVLEKIAELFYPEHTKIKKISEGFWSMPLANDIPFILSIAEKAQTIGDEQKTNEYFHKIITPKELFDSKLLSDVHDYTNGADLHPDYNINMIFAYGRGYLELSKKTTLPAEYKQKLGEYAIALFNTGFQNMLKLLSDKPPSISEQEKYLSDAYEHAVLIGDPAWENYFRTLHAKASHIRSEQGRRLAKEMFGGKQAVIGICPRNLEIPPPPDMINYIVITNEDVKADTSHIAVINTDHTPPKKILTNYPEKPDKGIAQKTILADDIEKPEEQVQNTSRPVPSHSSIDQTLEVFKQQKKELIEASSSYNGLDLVEKMFRISINYEKYVQSEIKLRNDPLLIREYKELRRHAYQLAAARLQDHLPLAERHQTLSTVLQYLHDDPQTLTAAREHLENFFARAMEEKKLKMVADAMILTDQHYRNRTPPSAATINKYIDAAWMIGSGKSKIEFLINGLDMAKEHAPERKDEIKRFKKEIRRLKIKKILGRI